MERVLEVMHTYKLFAKMTKCSFGRIQVKYLGHVISGSGVTMDPFKVRIVQQWPTPKNVT